MRECSLDRTRKLVRRIVETIILLHDAIAAENSAAQSQKIC